jgi:ABC-type dipeptide/oligopeptide/nickel transport system permease component
MKPSLELIGITIVAATVIGLLGAVAAVSTQGRFLDRAITSLAAVAQAMPSFWLALLLILVFAVHLAVLPATGMTGVSSIVLPVATLTVALVPYVLRVARSSILETFREDFIRFQVARGIPARSILFKHALRSSLAPVVAMIGLQTGLLLSGVVVIEQIFGRSGIGRLLLTAILQRNYPVVQAAVIAIAIVVVLANLLADLLIAALDPRVRLAHGSAT